MTNDLINVSWWIKEIGPEFLSVLILWLFAKGIKVISSLKTNMNKRNKLKMLKRIKNIRNNNIKIIREIIKNYAYFIGFLVLASVYLYGIVLDVDLSKENNREFVKSLFLLSSPVFILEIMWLKQSKFLDELILRANRMYTTARAGRIRITTPVKRNVR